MINDLTFETMCLLLKRPMYGHELLKEFRKTSGWMPSPGSLYPVLYDLKKRQLVSTHTEERKKYYSLSPEGELLINKLFADKIFDGEGKLWKFDPQLTNIIIKKGELKPGDVVLDAAAKHGFITFKVSHYVHKVIALNPTATLEQELLKFLRQHGTHNVETKRGEIINIPLRGNSVDTVFCAFARHCFFTGHREYPLIEIMRELLRVAKIGGNVVFLDLVKRGNIFFKSFFGYYRCCGEHGVSHNEVEETVKKLENFKCDIENLFGVIVVSGKKTA